MNEKYLQETIAAIKKTLLALEDALQSKHGPRADTPMPAAEPTSPIYLAAKAALGVRITLDVNVSSELGCAEAVSYVLHQCNVPNVPPKGFPGTAALYHWLCSSGLFDWEQDPEPGDIIISPTGSPTATMEHGHTGIVGLHGILSNNSFSGKFDEHITLAAWRDFYQARGHFPVYFFRWIHSSGT